MGREMGGMLKREGTCIPIADSCWDLPENNKIL